MNDDATTLSIGVFRLSLEQKSMLAGLLPPHDKPTLWRLANGLGMAYDLQQQTDTFIVGADTLQRLDAIRMLSERIKRELEAMNAWDHDLFKQELWIQREGRGFDPLDCLESLNATAIIMLADRQPKHRGPTKTTKYLFALGHIREVFKVAFPTLAISCSETTVFHRVVDFYFSHILGRKVSAKNEIKKLLEVRG